MFGTSKLVRTPVKPGQSSGKHEFTPIGTRTRSVNHDEVLQQNMNQGSRPLFRPIFEDPEVALRSEIDSTFDNTTEVPILAHNTNSEKPPSSQANPFTLPVKHPDFINGFSSIKEQQDKLKSLDSENYMLRLKVVTLQRILNETPQEKRQLFADTINLQQQLVKARQQIEEYERLEGNKENLDQIDQMRYELKAKDQQLNELKLRLQSVNQLQETDDILREKNRQLHEYELKIQALQQSSQKESTLMREIQLRDEQIHDLNLQLKNQSSNSKDHDHLLHQLQGKDDQLLQIKSQLAEIQQALRSRDEEIFTLKQRLESESRRDGEDQSLLSTLKLKNQQIEDLESRLSNLQNTNSKSQQIANELDSVNRDLNRAAGERDQLSREILELKQALRASEDDKSQAQQKLHKSNDQVKQLELKINNLNKTNGDASFWKSKYTAIESEIQNLDSHQRDYKLEISNLKSEVAHLTNKLTLAERELHKKDQNIRNQEEHVNDNEALNRTLRNKVESLEFEIKQRDKEEDNLRKQISTLLQLNNLLHSQDEIDKHIETESALRNQIAKLTFELENARITSSSGDNNVSELTDRLKFYEAEYEELQSKLKVSLSNETGLQQELNMKQRMISNLEDENKILNSQSRSTSFDKSTLLLQNNERLQKNNQRLEEENRSLMQKLDSTNLELTRLQRTINDSQMQSSSYLNSEIDRLLAENSKLKQSIQQNSLYGNKNYRLNDELQAKDFVIKNLEEKLVNLEVEKDKLMRDKYSSQKINNSSDEIRIRKLELEIDELRREKDMEVNNFETKLRGLELNQRRKPDSSNGTAIQSLLELQLQEAIKSKENADKLAENYKSENLQLQKQLALVENERKLLEENKSSAQTEIKLRESEKKRLETKVQNLNEEILKITRKSNSMRDEIEQLQQEKAMHDKMENLNIRNTDELSKAIMEKLQLQREVETLKRTKEIKPFQDDSMQSKQLDKELMYYKARMKDIMYKSNDLQVMHSFIMGSIKNSNRLLHNEINNFVKCGIYPDYSSANARPKLTFKVVAKFVLSAIRMKNRYEKSERRKQQLLELRTEIEIGKIKLKQK